MVRLLLFLTCCIGLLLPAHSQLPFKHLIDLKGWPMNHWTTDLLISADDDLWCSYFGGVCRYNSASVEWYDTQYFEDADILKMTEDKQGRIWFVSYLGKMAYWEDGEIRNFPLADSISLLLAGNQVTSFVVGEDDKLHIGHSGEGYFTLDMEGKLDWKVDRQMPYRNHILIQLENGEPFVFKIVDRGVQPPSQLHLLRRDLTLERTIQFPETVALPSMWRVATSHAALPGGGYALGFESTLILLQEDTLQHWTTNDRIIGVFVDAQQCLWVGTNTQGLFRFPNCRLEQEQKLDDLPAQKLAVMAEDHEGGLWLKSNQGVYQLPTSNMQLFNQGAATHSVFQYQAIWQDKLYVASEGALYQLDENGLVLDSSFLACIAGKTETEIYALYADEMTNSLWVGGKKKVFIKTDKGWSILDENDLESAIENLVLVRGICRNPIDSSMWLASSNALIRLDSTVQCFPWEQREKLVFRELQITDEGAIWVGTQGGLAGYGEQGYFMDTLAQSRGVGHVSALMQHQGVLWIGTINNGLWMRHKDTIVQVDAHAQGLQGNLCNIHGFVRQGSDLIAESSSGITRLTLLDRDALQVKATALKQLDPQGYTGAPVVIGKQKLYQTYGNSVVVHDLSKDLQPYPIPKLKLEQVWVNERDTALNPSYKLEHDQNNIRIKYVGVSYLSERPKWYQVKVEGWHQQWITTNEREFYLTNLPPGNYTFQVRCKNHFGQWSKQPLQLSLTIQLPFWNTWWWYTLLTCGTVLLIALLWKVRSKQLEKRSQLVLDLERSRHRALSAQLNPHFVFNALNSIYLFAEENKQEAVSKYLLKFAKLMRTTLDNSDNGMIPIAEELDAIRDYLDLERMRLNNRFDYHIGIDDDVYVKQWKVPTLLIQPYIENAVKHGVQHLAAHGKINIQLKKKHKTCLIQITDNGIGREKTAGQPGKKNHRSKGNQINSERLQLMKSIYSEAFEVEIFDLDEERDGTTGTKVIIEFPIILQSPN